MAHIIGHGRYAHETYPERSGLGAQGPQGTQGNQGAQGPQGTQGSQASVTEANVRAALALSTGPVTINNQNLTNVKIGSLNGVVNDGSSGATKNINWSAGAAHLLTLTANCTLTFTVPPGPCTLSIKLIQDVTGGWLVTWPTMYWPNGSPPTLTTTPSSGMDLVTLWYDGVNFYGLGTANNLVSV